MTNILDPVTNFAIAVIDAIDDSATTANLASGKGALFPAPATDGAFNVIIFNSTDYRSPSDDPNKEILRITGRSTDALTFTRAQEGTSAATHNTGGKVYKIVLANTKKMRDDIEAKIAGTNVPVKASGSDINTGTDDAKFATSKAIADSFLGVQGGWSSLGDCSYEGADDPTYTFSLASDMTGILSVGMRIKLTDSGVQYFIITSVGAFSGGKTIITVYGGTDYNLSGGAITYPYYSTQKAPLGFPLSPVKWTVEVTDTTLREQTTPTQNTWYNIGSLSISVPIGAWNLMYFAVNGIIDTGTSTGVAQITLSTANNSESEAGFSSGQFVAGASGDLVSISEHHKSLFVLLASKTSYYLNSRTSSAGVTTIQTRSDLGKTILRAVCAYL